VFRQRNPAPLNLIVRPTTSVLMGILGAIILYVLVSTMSDADVEANRWRILGVVLGIGVVEFLLSRILVGWVWGLVMLLVEMGLIALALTFWCGVPRKQALKIAGVYTGIRIAIGIALILVLPRV
jgi:hypothetical protein